LKTKKEEGRREVVFRRGPGVMVIARPDIYVRATNNSPRNRIIIKKGHEVVQCGFHAYISSNYLFALAPTQYDPPGHSNSAILDLCISMLGSDVS
jgi:hypothetical protein